MPGGDQTGPTGAGPMTGRAMGYCAGNQQPGSFFGGRGMGRGRGRGFGRGRGMGRGWGNRAFASAGSAIPDADRSTNPPVAQADADQLNAVKAQVSNIASMLAELKQQIASLEPRNNAE